MQSTALDSHSADPHNGDDNPFRYSGEYYDEETGFIYLRARYYDPTIGRFISEDPIRDGLNWYAYCNNNPVMYVDPSGLDGVPIWATNILNSIETEQDIMKALSVDINQWAGFARCSVEEAVRLAKNQQTQLVSKGQLYAMGWKNVNNRMVADLNDTLRKYDITSTEGIRHFLSQVSVESLCGTMLHEKYNGTPEEYFKKVDGGAKYRGAGYIHLTHKYNYQAFANYVNDPKVVDEGYSYVEKYYAWEAAGWFWSVYTKGLKEKADAGASVEQITLLVNGGNNALDERKRYYDLATKIGIGGE